MTNPQIGTVCPQCGSAAAVHSIAELAVTAQNEMERRSRFLSGALGQQGAAAPPQQGYAGPPQPGAPQPGFGGTPQPGAPQPGAPQAGFGGTPQPGAPQPGAPQPGPVPGWAAQPRPGPPGGRRGMRSRLPNNSSDDEFSLDSVEGAVAGVAITAAAKFIGRRLGRYVQQTTLPAMAARQQEILQIAERHPDLRACLNDKVAFLAGGSRVQPMPSLTGPFTVEQADALVARLRNG